MARVNYEMQLKELKNQMTLLGSMVEAAVSGAVNAFALQNKDQAKEIAEGDYKINAQVRVVEQMCYDLLLRQQPVARDLRSVSAALKMITDLERIGDHAEDISELTLLMAGSEYPGLISEIKKMAKETSVMLISAVDAYAMSDYDKAQQVIDEDDVVDRLFDVVKQEISEQIRRGEANAEQVLDLLMAAKYFERIGDHATNIAEWVLFSKTGDFPE